MADRQPTEEELRAKLEEELKRLRVDQVVIEATVSILNVAAMRAGLGPGGEQERDLDQARVGIDAVRALLPVVEQAVGAQQARPIRDALAQLQMAYVRAVGAGAGDAAGPGGGAAAGGAQGGAARPDAGGSPPRPGEPGPAQRSGRLWVPGQ